MIYWFKGVKTKEMIANYPHSLPWLSKRKNVSCFCGTRSMRLFSSNCDQKQTTNNLFCSEENLYKIKYKIFSLPPDVINSRRRNYKSFCCVEKQKDGMAPLWDLPALPCGYTESLKQGEQWQRPQLGIEQSRHK